MAQTLPASQNKRRALYRNLMIVVLALVALTAFASRAFGLELHGAATLLLVAGFVLAVLQFNALDEMARQAHYVAWYWGGMIALGVIAALNMTDVVATGASDRLASAALALIGESEPSGAFMAGLLATPLMMLVGFGAWWAAYWLRRS